jgi:hypothetical protein
MLAAFAPRLGLAVLFLAGSHALSSQAAPHTMPAGRHEYVVRGFFQGDEMEPWASELSVADTTIGGERGVRALYRSRQTDAGWLYTFSAAWSRQSPVVRAEWINGGQMPGRCSVAMEHGELTGRLDDGTVPAPVRVADYAVTDFAIGAYLAARPLAARDTIRLTMFRCLPVRGVDAIESQPIVSVVRDGEESRGGMGQPEPVWIVEGDKTYPFVAVIAKRDRLLLRSVTPQGSVGYSTESYVRTR